MLPNAHRAITTIRAQGKRTVFLSNNPTHTRQEYAAKLLNLAYRPAPAISSTRRW
ncbi:MAG: hypothetical protein U0559_20235 [Anaerolineae bacterium]